MFGTVTFPPHLRSLTEALARLKKLRHLLPTSPDTAPDDRTNISSAIAALHSAIDSLPKRSRKRKEGGEEEKRADWLDEEGGEGWLLTELI